MDHLHDKIALFHPVARLDDMQLCPAEQTVLPQFPLDQADGQPSAVDRNIYLFEQIGQPTDMVLMAVGDKNAADLIRIALHIGEIRDHQVDSRHIGIREGQAAVDEDHIVPALKERHILPNFIDAAEKRNAHRHFGQALFNRPASANGGLPGNIFLYRSGCLGLFCRLPGAGGRGRLCLWGTAPVCGARSAFGRRLFSLAARGGQRIELLFSTWGSIDDLRYRVA